MNMDFISEVSSEWKDLSYSEQRNMLNQYPELKEAGFTLTAFNPNDIQIGDSVYFGDYGTHYVCGYGETDGLLRVTDSKEDRNSQDTRGFFLDESLAKEIKERGN